jgi:hypothetical protein
MPNARVSVGIPSKELRKNGTVVGLTDRVYEVKGDTAVLDEVLVKGDLSGQLDYNGHVVEVTHIDTAIGLEVGDRGARGPLWKHVVCRVIR